MLLKNCDVCVIKFLPNLLQHIKEFRNRESLDLCR